MVNAVKYPTSTSTGVTLNEVRKSLVNIEYLEPGIHIPATQPGSGKSTALMEIISKNTDIKVLIISNNHNLFETTYDMILNEPNTVHYQGWGRLCLKKEDNHPNIQGKRTLPSISPQHVCDVCCSKDEITKCPYHKQKRELKNARIVVTVPMLVSTILNEFTPDLVIIDENSTYNDDFIFIEKDVNFCLEKLVEEYINIKDDSYVYPLDLGDSIIQTIKKDSSYLKSYLNINKDGNCVKNKGVFSADGMINQWIVEYPTKKYMDTNMWSFYNDIWNMVFKHSLAKFNEPKYAKLTKILLKIQPFKLEGYVKRHFKYKIDTKVYYDPYEYRIFDWVEDNLFPVVMLDASFNRERFETFYDNWAVERDIDTFHHMDLKINIYTSEIKIPEIVITHIQKGSKFHHPKDVKQIYNNNSYKYYYDSFERTLDNIKKAGYSLAVISNFATEKICLKGHGILSAHFYNLRGLNTLQNVDYLFIFETPQQPIDSKFFNSEKNGYGFLEDARGQKQIGLLDTYIGLFKRIPTFYPKNQLSKNSDGHFVDRATQKVGVPGKVIRKGNIHDNNIEIQRYGWVFDKELEFRIHEEVYQAIHRARPLINDSTKIYVMGTMPEKIHNEFTVDNISWDEFVGTWDKSKYIPSTLHKKIYNLSENFSTEEICKQLNLFKETKCNGYNTHFVEAMFNITLKQIEQLDKCINTNISKLPFKYENEGRYNEKRFLKDLKRHLMEL